MTAPISAPQSSRGYIPAEDLINRLCTSAKTSTAGPLVAAAQAIFTFGLLPLVIWTTRWATYVDRERPDLLELIGRWRSRVAPKDARKLDKIARRLRRRPILMVLPWLVVAFTGTLIGILLVQGDSLAQLRDLTFRHGLPFPDHARWVTDVVGPLSPQFDALNDPNDFRSQIESHLFFVWTAGLILAYSIHYHAVRTHAAVVQSLASWTNRLAEANRLPVVNTESLNTGIRPLWIVLAIILCMFNAWWGIPMVLAAAMQRRYMQSSGPQIRAALGLQLRDGFAMTPADAVMSRFCTGAHCGGRLPTAANYCPRCGSPAVFVRRSGR